jgi:hypothetical protein
VNGTPRELEYRPTNGEPPVRAASPLLIPVEVIDCERELSQIPVIEQAIETVNSLLQVSPVIHEHSK